MKLLFLDVDGVLNYQDWGVKHGLVPVPSPYQPTVEELVKWIDPERMELVNQIIRRTGCQVVLSSSTRSDPRMSVVLAKAGLCVPILEATPVLLWKVDERGVITGVTSRADEIWEVVEKHNPTTWCVLDDVEYDWQRVLPRLWGDDWSDPVIAREGHLDFVVQTTFATGIQPHHVERAVEILNQERMPWVQT